ncbi:MAG TPA: hypothetical protein ENI05_05850 [Porticoccus sp.]|nr:hypothetical protein [Porticoccus sp.]
MDARYPVLRLVPINAREVVRVAVLQDVLLGVPTHVSKTVPVVALQAVLKIAPAPVLMRVSDAPSLAQVAVSRPASEAALAAVLMRVSVDARPLALVAVLEVGYKRVCCTYAPVVRCFAEPRILNII